ncbi:MAG: phytanoyl-CoA dioxygenase family protein [Algiphilus sp.]
MLNKNYQIDREAFKRQGYGKITALFDMEFIAELRQLCDKTINDSSFVSFKKNKFNVGIDESSIRALLGAPEFAELLTDLMGSSMMLTDGIVFELDSSRSGFDWHIGVTSFKYISPDDAAVSIWIPLDPVDTSEQDGSISFISKEWFNGREFYKLQHRATDSIAQGRYILERGYASMAGCNRYTGVEGDCVESLRSAARKLSPHTYSESLYFSAFARNLLERERETFNFDLGDAALFTKDVFHRSNGFRAGPMPSRRAFVLRFIDINSTYDEVSDRIMGGESAEVIEKIKLGHGKKYNIDKAICLFKSEDRRVGHSVTSAKAAEQEL